MRTTAIHLLLVLAASPAAAQDPQQTTRDRLLRGPYIAPGGATVDKPGEPQGSAPTSLDRSIQRDNDKIDGSLCKGC